MSECTCTQCRGACEREPGMFKPNEIKATARFLHRSVVNLVKRGDLVGSWFDRAGVRRWAMVPGKQPNGHCVFLRDGKCSIYPVRPFECQQFTHGDSGEAVRQRLIGVVGLWAAPETQRRAQKLLGVS